MPWLNGAPIRAKCSVSWSNFKLTDRTEKARGPKEVRFRTGRNTLPALLDEKAFLCKSAQESFFLLVSAAPDHS